MNLENDMDKQDIAAAKAARRSTLKSLKAKRECRIKDIQEKAAEEIRQVNIQFSSDPERLKAKYAADAAYRSERSKRRALKAQKRAEARIAYEIKMKREERLFSFGEELFNSITIGIGAGLSVAALVLFIVHAVNLSPEAVLGRTVTSYTLAGVFLFLLYLMSTFSHALCSYSAKRVFRILTYDFAFLYASAIMSLFALVIIRGAAGWLLFGLCWALAVFSVAFYSSLEAKPSVRKTGMRISALLFAALLIAELILLKPLLTVVPVKLLILAAVSCAVAELFHTMKRVRWTNCIFHLLMIIANIFCFFTVYSILP